MDRGLSPLSITLYPIQFDEHTDSRRRRRAVLTEERVPVEITRIVDEIRRELAEPTLPVREILDPHASEADARTYLQHLADPLQMGISPINRNPGWTSGTTERRHD